MQQQSMAAAERLAIAVSAVVGGYNTIRSQQELQLLAGVAALEIGGDAGDKKRWVE